MAQQQPFVSDHPVFFSPRFASYPEFASPRLSSTAFASQQQLQPMPQVVTTQRLMSSNTSYVDLAAMHQTFGSGMEYVQQPQFGQMQQFQTVDQQPLQQPTYMQSAFTASASTLPQFPPSTDVAQLGDVRVDFGSQNYFMNTTIGQSDNNTGGYYTYAQPDMTTSMVFGGSPLEMFLAGVFSSGDENNTLPAMEKPVVIQTHIPAVTQSTDAPCVPEVCEVMPTTDAPCEYCVPDTTFERVVEAEVPVVPIVVAGDVTPTIGVESHQSADINDEAAIAKKDLERVQQAEAAANQLVIDMIRQEDERAERERMAMVEKQQLLAERAETERRKQATELAKREAQEAKTRDEQRKKDKAEQSCCFGGSRR